MATTADRTVAVELLAKVSGYTAGMAKAAEATERTAVAMAQAAKAQSALEAGQRRVTASTVAASKAAAANAAAHQKQLAAMTTLGRGFVVLGAAAALGLGAAARASMNFGREMANIRALLGHNATTSQLKQLSEAALTVGQQFGYTATQVADAEAELVKAGVSVTDILGGALTGSLTLAAAGQTNLAEATTIAASAMTVFGLKGKDIPHIADLLAAGADKALGSVSDLGLGLQQVATPAAQAGISIENTVGALAALAQAGQIGERGGTSLKQVLLQLQNPSKQAADLMQRYGISLYDAAGNTKDFTALAGNLRTSLEKLSPAQRANALSVIFGSHAVQAANVLYANSAKGIQDWTDRSNDAAFATGQATQKLNSLSGDLQKLGAAFQTSLIRTGDQATGTLRNMVQAVTGLLDAFNSVGPGVRTAIVGVTTLVAVTGLAGGAALIAVPKYVAFRNALRELRGEALLTTEALSAEAIAAGRAGVASGAAGAAASRGALSKIGRAAGPIGLLASGLAIGKSSIDASVAGRVQSKTDDLASNPTKLAEARKQLAGLAAQIKAVQAAQQNLPGAAHAGRGASSTGLSVLVGQYDELSKVVKGATAAAGGNTAANEANAPSLIKVGQSAGAAAVDITTLGTALDLAGSKFDVQASQDAVTQGFKDLKKQVAATTNATHGNSAAALANRAALRQQFDASLKSIQSYANQKDAQGRLVHSSEDVKRKADQVATAFQNGAAKAGIGKRKTDDYAAALRNVPKSVGTTITVNADLTNAQRALGVLQGQLNKLNANPTGPGGFMGGTVRGNRISRFSVGGSVFGGPVGRDTVPALLDNGEEVISKRPATKWRPLLKAINADRMASGGTAGQPNLSDIFSLIQTSGGTKAKPLTPFATQFATATATTTRTDAQFIANLNQLAARGFGFLAMQLLEQGDHTAKVVAAQAVKWGRTRLSATQAGLQKSAAQQKQLGLLPAELAISSALRSGKNPTLGSIAAATGLDIEDLQAGLQAMQKGLRGNRNAAQLLRGLNTVGSYQQSTWGSTSAMGGSTIIQVTDKSGDPIRAGEKAAMGYQRHATVSAGRW